jgi:hypothetical protein
MRLLRNWSFALFLFAATLGSSGLMTGCAVHARVYDPYYHDYHGWNGETVYYNQWEHDTHREHRDFNKRNDDEKKEYWDWRHKQNDHH